jgi:hypothetical protein
MTERTDPFANLREMPAFERKTRPVRPSDVEAIDVIAEESGFVSRHPAKPAKTPKRKPRLHRTGRNENFTLKVTKETRERFHRMADERSVILARLLELALDALEQQGRATTAL